MQANANERRALEREALRNVINQWNDNRLDLFELSEPNENLEFHGVMRFYFQDSGQKVATKCIRVASDATVENVIGTLVEKFRPDMRMLSVPSYALYELHEGCPERRMLGDEKPLLVQLNWHVDDREGRFLLKNIDDKTVSSMHTVDSTTSFRRKLSRREKKQLKRQEKLSRVKSENGGVTNNSKKDGVAEKLYTELPETSFTRSISNPEAVMRRRRQQKFEKKLQQFRSKDGGPDTGGTLKIYGEALCRDVPYKTLLLSVRDTAGSIVREMLDKYGLTKVDPSQWCLVQVTQINPNAGPSSSDIECILDDDECPLSIVMSAPNAGSIMFHVRRRPADSAPRKRKKKPGALGNAPSNFRETARDESTMPVLVELGPDGSMPQNGDSTIVLNSDMLEVGSANGVALQLYGPHIQPRHCVIKVSDGVASVTPCHCDAHTYVNGQRIHQTTLLTHGSVIKFGSSSTYRFLDPCQEDGRYQSSHHGQYYSSQMSSSNSMGDILYQNVAPRAYDPSCVSLNHEASRDNVVETTFDLDGNVETVSTTSGPKDDNRSLSSSTDHRLGATYPPSCTGRAGMGGQDPILPAVLEFPEESQEPFLSHVVTHLDVTVPTFRLAPAYTLYLCARYRASTHYRPDLSPTERAHKLTVMLHHVAMLVRRTIQERAPEPQAQAFWLANASELLHFLKSDRHISPFSLQAQDTLADAVQTTFKNLVACLCDELGAVLGSLVHNNGMSGVPSKAISNHNNGHFIGEQQPRELISVLAGAMTLIRNSRVNAALTLQLFSQLFHWIAAKGLATVLANPSLCTRAFGLKLLNRLRHVQMWAESQGLEVAAECHLGKVVQCAHLLQAPKYSVEDLAKLSSVCFKLNSLQLRALLLQYKPETGEKLAPVGLLEQAAKAAENVADELTRAEGREVELFEDPAPHLQLLLPDDGYSSDLVHGVPPGLADFLHPLQSNGLCRLTAQPTSSGLWTVYMAAQRPASALSSTQPEIQAIRLHKSGGGIGLSIVAAKGAGQERLGIYIKSVVPGGAADRDGRLAAGDQLLSVDGQSLLGISQEKAAEFLVRTGSVVTLEVAKGGAVYHGLATLLQQPSPTPPRGNRRMSERDLTLCASDASASYLPPQNDLMRYPSANNLRISEATQRAGLNHPTSQTSTTTPYLPSATGPDYGGGNAGGGGGGTIGGVGGSIVGGVGESVAMMRASKSSDDMFKQSNEMLQRYASSGNIRMQPYTQTHVNHQMGATIPPPNDFSRIPSNRNLADSSLHEQRIKLQTQQQQQHHQQHQQQLQNQQLAQYYGPSMMSPTKGSIEESLKHSNEMLLQRHASSGNVRVMQQQHQHQPPPPPTSSQSYHITNNSSIDMLRGQAKMSEMTEEVRRRHLQQPSQPNYLQQQRLSHHYPATSLPHHQPPYQHHNPMAHSLQNLNIHSQQHTQPAFSHATGVQKSPPVAPKPVAVQHQRKEDSPPEPPPTSTHPLYSASAQDHGPRTSQYANNTSSHTASNKPLRDPWVREEEERLAEARKELTRQSQEQQILELLSISDRTPQQNEQLRLLQLEHEFQRRVAIQAAEQEDEEEDEAAEQNEKTHLASSSCSSVVKGPLPPTKSSSVSNKLQSRHSYVDTISNNTTGLEQNPVTSQSLHLIAANNAQPPPPPERGSSFAVMNLRHSGNFGNSPNAPNVSSSVSYLPQSLSSNHITNTRYNHMSHSMNNYNQESNVVHQYEKEPVKRISFNETVQSSSAMSDNPMTPTTPTLSLQLKDLAKVREDPNAFIRQAELMLASPVTPPGNDSGNAAISHLSTPGVIGAQEVYRDPRARRLAEQAQQRNQSTIPVPEKLSFKEKMKMFAMETGENETPKDKSKISRAQREIDSLGSPSVNLVH